MGVVKLSTAGIVNYQKYDDFLAGNAAYQPPGTYELLETTLLTGTQASVTFSNLNTNYGSTYQHLQIRMLTRSTTSGSGDGVDLRLNGDTGNNYSEHRLQRSGGGVSSSAAASTNAIIVAYTAGSANANVFGPAIVDILDAFETTKNKTIRSLGGDAGHGGLLFSSGMRMNTEAITSITLLTEGGSNSFTSGCRFSLYGLRSA